MFYGLKLNWGFNPSPLVRRRPECGETVRASRVTRRPLEHGTHCIRNLRLPSTPPRSPHLHTGLCVPQRAHPAYSDQDVARQMRVIRLRVLDRLLRSELNGTRTSPLDSPLQARLNFLRTRHDELAVGVAEDEAIEERQQLCQRPVGGLRSFRVEADVAGEVLMKLARHAWPRCEQQQQLAAVLAVRRLHILVGGQRLDGRQDAQRLEKVVEGKLQHLDARVVRHLVDDAHARPDEAQVAVVRRKLLVDEAHVVHHLAPLVQPKQGRRGLGVAAALPEVVRGVDGSWVLPVDAWQDGALDEVAQGRSHIDDEARLDETRQGRLDERAHQLRTIQSALRAQLGHRTVELTRAEDLAPSDGGLFDGVVHRRRLLARRRTARVVDAGIPILVGLLLRSVRPAARLVDQLTVANQIHPRIILQHAEVASRRALRRVVVEEGV
eukprot:7389666-Prymnesium_polylepis.2